MNTSGSKFFSYLLLFAGLVVIMTSTVLEGSLVIKSRSNYRNNMMNKVVVNLKNPSEPFSIEDMKILKDKLGKKKFTYTTEYQKTVYADLKSKTANIIGADPNYNELYYFNFISGGFFNKDMKKDYVAVIDEELAWNLFGNIDVVGSYIKILNNKYKIIGVISADKSILKDVYNLNNDNVYIPVDTLLEIDKEAQISSVQIADAAKSDLINILNMINKSPDNYNITDYSLKGLCLPQVPLIEMFILGVISIIIIIIYMLRKIEGYYLFIRNEYGNCLFYGMLKNYYTRIFIELLKMVISVFTVYLLWKYIKFDIYIPAEDLPKNFIDISAYWDLFKNTLSNNIISENIIHTRTDVVYQTTMFILNGLLLISVFLGLPLIYLGLYRLRSVNMNFYTVLPVISIGFIFSLLFTVAIIIGMELPLKLEFKNIIVLFLFIHLCAYKIFELGGLSRYEKNMCFDGTYDDAC